MFSFFKKKQDVPLIGTLLGGADMHAHLIPGVDDGAPDIETSLRLIKGLHELGYNRLIATPHVYWDVHKNDPSTLAPAYNSLKETLAVTLPSVSLHLAAEYMLNEHFEMLVRQKEELLTVSENKVLVEFSYTSFPLGWKEILFELQINGYQPVMAHPERYIFAHRDRSFYNELQDAGCLLQLNLLSVAGYYGPAEQSAARYLLKNKMYSYAGTDCHHDRHLSRLSDPVIASALREIPLLNKNL